MELPVVDPRASRTGRWLRERRLRFAVWIAVIEGLLVLFGVIPGWFALLIGAIIVLFYVLVGRSAGSDAVAQASWTAAMSQVLMALVPVAAFVLSALAIVVLVVIALLALALLVGDRR